MSKSVSNERFRAFTETIIKQVRKSLIEREDDLLQSWQENIEEADANEKKFPPLRIALSAVVDLESNKIATTLQFRAIYKSTVTEDLPDPNQPVLAGFEDPEIWKN